MPTTFTFNAYVVSVIDKKRLCVRIDKDCVSSVCNRLSNAADRTTFKDTIIINLLTKCEFKIDFEWQELDDLVGCHLHVSAFIRKYNFWRPRESFDPLRNLYTSVKQKGVSVVATAVASVA